MKCPRCQHDNPSHAKFCLECGARLAFVCAKCQSELPSGAKFCLECGTPVASRATAESSFATPGMYTPKFLADKILTSKSALEGERKQVTVLFSDLKGSMELLADRDPEEARKILDPVLAHMMDAVHRFEGTVNQVMGDGIMALFGAPLAHEDHAVRACYAALRMQEVVRNHSQELRRAHGVEAQIRVGINSGEVVVRSIGNDLRMDYTAVGQTTHLAARMEQLAAPGSIRLTATTLRLAEGIVEVTPLGPVPIKGLGQPIEVFELVGVGTARTRFEAAMRRGLTHFVGRNAELEQLRDALDRASRGHGQVVAVIGEPGIGKSRLIYEFCQRASDSRAFLLTGNCFPDGRQTPFRPFIEILRGLFRIASGDDEATIGGKLDDNLKVLGLASTQNRSLLLHLLGLKFPEGSLQGLDGPLIGLRTREILQEILRARCRLSPVLLILEDLHWIDHASEEVLGRIVYGDNAMPLMIASTYRPEYRPPWLDGLAVRQLLLQPLSTSEILQIVAVRLGCKRLPEALARLIAERSEGNALFAEEIASFLLDRAIVRFGHNGLEFDAATVASALPESVQSLLNSRIDRLSFRDREVLQAAAVIGRRFDSFLLAAVTGSDPQESLATAQALDLVQEASDSDDRVFRHALIRDALYGSLLSESRATLHLKVAEQIEVRSANRLDEVAEVLAHHYGLTARADKAFRYLGLAGRKSLDRYAVEQAQRFLRQALTLFESKPDCADNGTAATVLVDMLEASFLKTDLPELMLVANRFMPMLEAMGDTPQFAGALFFVSHTQCISCDFRTAAATARRALEVGKSIGDAKAIARARTALLFCVSALGETPLELAQKEARETLSDAERADDAYNVNWAYWNIAWDHLMRGLMKDAERWTRQLIASGRERNDRRALGLAYWTLAWINISNAQYDAAILNADDCLRAAVTPWDEVVGTIAKAAATVFQGDAQAGLTQIQDLRLWASEHATRYAEAAMDGAIGVGLVLSGRVSEGISLLERAIDARDAEGFRGLAALNRITLAEIYLEILTARQRPPMRIIVRNFWALMGAMMFGASRAEELLKKAAAHKQLHEEGAVQARIKMDLGLLFKHKKQPGRARDFLEMARSPAELQGATSLLSKIDAALAELR